MRISEINNSKVDNLADFINVLSYGDPALIETKGVLVQGRLLEILSLLLSRAPASDRGMDYNLFVSPGVEQFFVRLIIGLDDTLEALAGEVFQKGWVYVAGFIGSHDAQHVVRRLLGAIGERFPQLQSKYDQYLESVVSAFFTPTLGEFLELHHDSVDLLSIDFPTVHALFVTPLLESSAYRAQRLFNFYCNPWIYNPILEFLALEDGEHCSSTRRLEWLENHLGEIRLFTNDESWIELATKCRELLNKSDRLESFASGCSGLLGEIRTAFYLVKNICRPGDVLIFLADDNRRGKKNKEKNCDLMIVRQGEGDRILIEVKTKSPRHGVEDVAFKVWDDFFTNYSSAICSYFSYLDRNTSPIFGLNLGKAFPQFLAHEGSVYGTALPVIYNEICGGQSKSDSLTCKWNTVKAIETLIRSLFLRPLILEPNCVPLPAENVRRHGRYQQTATALEKEWLSNEIRNAIIQLQTGCERLKKEGLRVSKLYVALDLTLSHRLLHDPLSYDDGNIRALAAEKIGRIFQPFKDELTTKGLVIELLDVQLEKLL